MNRLKIIIFFCIILSTNSLQAQCNFQYISNDTSFQDYIDFVFSPKDKDRIITIGSRLNRKTSNSKQFNTVLFETFDYCGNIQIQEVYSNVDRYKIKHLATPMHNTYLDEPIGNFAISISDNEYLIVDKATDTISLAQVLLLFRVNANGILKSYQALHLSTQEANQNVIKNVLKLQTGKYLIILWDNNVTYWFYYFDENLNLILKKPFNLGRGIRSIKDTKNGQFVCSSLAYDVTSFQFYKLDTSGEIKWITTPYLDFGSIRDLQIIDDKIYLTGGTMGFGAFIISDTFGNILKEFKYDTPYCNQRFCSALIRPTMPTILSGYINYCDSSNKNGTDVIILSIDSNGRILYNTSYDLRNSLGTSGEGGYFTDIGGFSLCSTNDSSVITNGISKYSDIRTGSTMHIDGTLIKSGQFTTNNKNGVQNDQHIKFELMSNPIIENLNIKGPLELIKFWSIFSLVDGKLIANGNYWQTKNFEIAPSGLYSVFIKDKLNHSHFLKFLKI